MKKSTILFAALFLLLPFVNGSDSLKKGEKIVVEERHLSQTTVEVVPVPNMLSLMEENQLLKRQNDLLTAKIEDLSNRLQYFQMMKVTLDQLQRIEAEDRIAETRSQLEFAKMMHTTLLHLNQIAGK